MFLTKDQVTLKRRQKAAVWRSQVAFLFALLALYFLQGGPDGRFAFSINALLLYAGLSALIVAVALIDDVWEVIPAHKFLAQLAAAILFAFFIARIDLIFLPGIGEFDLGSVGVCSNDPLDHIFYECL